MRAPAKPPFKTSLIAGLLALAATIVFYIGARSIAPLTEWLTRNRLAEKITMESIPRILERKERFNEIREFLDARIKETSVHDEVYAFRARLEAIEHGPEKGFQLLASLIPAAPMREQTAHYLEMARLAAMAGRWDDFFRLGIYLNDYGQKKALGQLLDELKQQKIGIDKALQTDSGLRFLACTGWDKQRLPDVAKLPADARNQLQLWKAEQTLRFEGKLADAATSATLAAALPNDPRAKTLLFHLSPQGKDAKALAPLLFDGPPALVMTDFTIQGKKFTHTSIYANGSYEAALPEATPSLWLLTSATPLLHVYPLIFVYLDDELSVHYLPYPRPFPEPLQRRDNKPFQRIKIVYVNNLDMENLKQFRDIKVIGFWPQSKLK